MRTFITLALVLWTVVSVESSARSFYRNFSSYEPRSHKRLITPNHKIVVRTSPSKDIICPPCPNISKVPTFRTNWGTFEVIRFTHLRPLGYRMTKETCDTKVCCQPLRKDIIMRGIF